MKHALPIFCTSFFILFAVQFSQYPAGLRVVVISLVYFNSGRTNGRTDVGVISEGAANCSTRLIFTVAFGFHWAGDFASHHGWLGEHVLGVLCRWNMWRPCPSVFDQVSAKLFVTFELILDENLFGKREFLDCRLSDSRALRLGLKKLPPLPPIFLDRFGRS
jgi:hypothetical protein